MKHELALTYAANERRWKKRWEKKRAHQLSMSPLVENAGILCPRTPEDFVENYQTRKSNEGEVKHRPPTHV